MNNIARNPGQNSGQACALHATMAPEQHKKCMAKYSFSIITMSQCIFSFPAQFQMSLPSTNAQDCAENEYSIRSYLLPEVSDFEATFEAISPYSPSKKNPTAVRSSVISERVQWKVLTAQFDTCSAWIDFTISLIKGVIPQR